VTVQGRPVATGTVAGGVNDHRIRLLAQRRNSALREPSGHGFSRSYCGVVGTGGRRRGPSTRWPRLSTTFLFGTTGDPLHGIMSPHVRVELALITRMVLMSVENRYPSLVMSAVVGITPALFPRRAVPCVL
jgi:hypothetical protein